MKKLFLSTLLILSVSIETFAINAPTLFSPSNGTTGLDILISLDWGSITGNEGYRYQIDTVSDFSSPYLINDTTGINSSIATASDLYFGTTYYWRVMTLSSSGNSVWSAIWNFTTKSTITNVSPVNGATNQDLLLSLDWSGITGNDGYMYQLDTTANFNSPLFIQSNTAYNTSIATASNLYFGTTYYWRACAKSVNDTSDWSATWSFTTRSTVTNASPSNGAINQDILLSLDWSGITGNDGYMYQLDTTANFNSPLFIQSNTAYNTSIATASNLYFGTTYYWRACAKSVNDTSDWSATWSFTTKNTVINYSPSDGATYQDTLLSLDWSSITGNDGYMYQLDTTANFNSPLFIQSNTAYNSSIASISNLYLGTTYYWRACAKSVNDTSDWSATWSFTTFYQLTTPVLITPINDSLDAPYSFLTFEWNSIANANSYQIQYSTDNTFSSGVGTFTTSLLNKDISNLQPNTDYYWRVRGANVNGYSPWSTIWHFKTETAVLIAPTLIFPVDNATAIDYNSTDFSWNSVFGANGYIFEISTDNTFTSGVTSQNLTGTTNNLIGLSPLTQYFWRVRATDGTTDGPWSSVWNFTTDNNVFAQSLSDDKDVMLSPNPANEKIIISANQQIHEVVIYSISGKIVLRADSNNYPVVINISEMKNGIYFVKMRLDNWVVIKKLIKN